MGEKTSLDKTSELYRILPFMESFPFGEYEITLEQEGVDPKDLGVDPILINVLGNFGTDRKINFFFKKGNAVTQIAFFIEDLLYLQEIAPAIKKLDSVNFEIDAALHSNELEAKLKQVKKNKKFIDLLGTKNLFSPAFEEVLTELLKIHEVTLTSQQILGLQKLSLTKLLSTPLADKKVAAANEFLDFQLHYVKLLLGIVVAAKIH